MACAEYENLDKEVKELLLNYKHKKATAYEPCSYKNYKECLIGLSEELDLLNIKYVFNPYCDVKEHTLRPEALVNLINTVWTVLYYHKSLKEKVSTLEEQNHILEQNNKHLNGTIDTLKEKLKHEENDSRACVATAQRVADRSDNLLQSLNESKAKLVRLNKQKDANEKNLKHEISRLKKENEKLLDRLRDKSGSYTPCTEVCSATLQQLRERSRLERAATARLQRANQQLLRELLAVKEELLVAGIEDVHLHHQ